MKRIISSDNVYVSESKIPKAGRGVFARCDIKRGEIIETCPFIEVPKNDLANAKSSILITYFFYFGKKKQRSLLALGFGSIYNHSYEPNSTFKINEKEKTISFIALKDIKMHEEITFNYKGLKNSKAKKTPLWFES